MSLMMPLAPNMWLMGFEIFALIMLVPAGLYYAGHALLRGYPKLFNALHWLFGLYVIYVLVAALTLLFTN